MTAIWRKSSYSTGSVDADCVELRRLPGRSGIGIRDSKNPEGGHLAVTPAALRVLVGRIKAGG